MSKVDKSSTPSKSGVSWSVSSNKNKAPCPFCSQDHPSFRCPTYVTVEARKGALYKEQRCVKCCCKGHHVAECKATLKCHNCKGTHHSALCSKRKSETKPASSKNTHSDTELSTVKTSPTDTNSVSASSAEIVAHSVSGKGSIALPTTLLRVKTRARDVDSSKICCFFDSGSRRSFVHPAVLQDLNLQPTGIMNMHLTAFGHDSEEITCPTIKLKLSLGSRVFSILFIVTEKVAMSLEVLDLKSVAKMLKGEGVKLADGQARDRVTDIATIIGADHFSKFIRGTHCVRGVNLFNSTGGHIIYGSLPYGSETSQLKEQSVIVSRVQLGDRSVDPCVVQDIVEPPVQQLWDLEAIGIQEERFTTGEQNALTSFSQSIFYDGFKYWVRLPL